MVSDRNQMKRRAQFVTKSAPEFNTDKAFVKQDEETEQEEQAQKEQTETPTLNDLTASSFVTTVEERVEEEHQVPEEQSQIDEMARQKFQTPSASLTEDLTPMESLPERTNRIKVAHLGVGALVTIVLATIVALYCSRRRRSWKRQRQIKTIGPWAAKNLHFHDENDITDDDFDSLEDGSNTRNHPHRPINERGPSFHLRAEDWLGGVGFDKNDESNFAENDGRYGDVDSVSEDDDESDTNVCDLLNGDSSNSQRGAFLLNGDSSNSKPSSLSLDSPPRSPVRLSPEPEFSPPTVSELFQNNLSALLKLSPPLSDGSCSNNDSSYECLQKKQKDLNKSLFLINDQILEQQRELEASAKALSEKMTRRKLRDLTIRHQNTKDGIELLESEKDRIDEKLKKVRSEIKSHRMERRRKLFQSSHQRR
jgi:hypothetical protein